MSDVDKSESFLSSRSFIQRRAANHRCHGSLCDWIHRVEDRMKNDPIQCSKLNYSLDQIVQNFRQFEALLSMSEDGKELLITNIKPNT